MQGVALSVGGLHIQYVSTGGLCIRFVSIGELHIRCVSIGELGIVILAEVGSFLAQIFDRVTQLCVYNTQDVYFRRP